MRQSIWLLIVLGLLAPSHSLAENAVEKAIAGEIARNLKESGRMQDYQIGIKMKGSTAWLIGQVASAEQQQSALDIARHTTGVDRVVSKLTIDDGENPLRERDSAADLASHNRSPVGSAESARPPIGRTSIGRPLPRPYAYLPGVHPAAAAQFESPPEQMKSPASDDGAAPIPTHLAPAGGGAARARFDSPVMPGYAWPSYAAYPNYAALTYPKQYSPTAWPYIGPFYPYPQVPLGWRKVTLEWDDGWWFLDFKD
jgi:hypothetical protein